MNNIDYPPVTRHPLHHQRQRPAPHPPPKQQSSRPRSHDVGRGGVVAVTRAASNGWLRESLRHAATSPLGSPCSSIARKAFDDVSLECTDERTPWIHRLAGAMLNPGVVYMLTSVVLFAVAVVVHFHTSHLSLPLSPVITALAVVLPIAAFVNAYIYPNLLRAAHACADTPAPKALPARLAPVVLQGLQAIVTAVLAALLLEGVVPSPALDFLLEHEWDSLFAARDGESIRLVQDTYRCCGLDAPDDRAYPFGGARSCAEVYGRTDSCMAPWRSAMQATSALDFGVVLAVGLMQILGLLMMRERTAWWTALRTQDWKHGSSQALLSPGDEETASRRGATPDGYGAVRANETGPSAEAERDTSNNQ